MELATNFIVKTACEKATPEMDKRLESEFTTRKQYRLEGRQYADPIALARAQQMPEKIRLRVGSVTNHQIVVYDEFSRFSKFFFAFLIEREGNLNVLIL